MRRAIMFASVILAIGALVAPTMLANEVQAAFPTRCSIGDLYLAADNGNGLDLLHARQPCWYCSNCCKQVDPTHPSWYVWDATAGDYKCTSCGKLRGDIEFV